MHGVPDPGRTGGIDWLERTNGVLTRAERRRLVAVSLRSLAADVPDRIQLARGRRATEMPPVPGPPDSRLARDAEAACAEQGRSVQGHSYRTWAFGRTLAALDGVTGLDEELFYVGCLLHDAGLETAVPGEDFTIRSAAAASACVAPHRDACEVRLVEDAISAHCTPGASVEVDGVHATYIQAGATADLLGQRLVELTAGHVADVHARHPRGAFVDDFTRFIAAEARAVPGGRFAMLHRLGFTLAMRASPSRRVP